MTEDQVPKRETVRATTAEDEVRRANRELMAYFKGRRSHREALAALKTIKRFVRAQQKKMHAGAALASGSGRIRKSAK